MPREEKDAPPKVYPTSQDGYRMIEQVGLGSQACVYRADCPSLQEDVAIKMIDLERFETDIESVAREIKALSICSHPNICKYHVSFVEGHHLWIVMQFMALGSCLDIMRAGFPEGMEEGLDRLRDVLKGLDYLHRNGMMHRNIKAGNILVSSAGEVRLADFGLTAELIEGGSRLERRQTFVGNPHWLAPEVLEQSGGYDAKADIWSFGMLALELVRGRVPNLGLPPLKVFINILQQDPPSLSEEEAEGRISKAFGDVVSMCLKKDPSQRPTAAKLLEHKFFKGAMRMDQLAGALVQKLSVAGESLGTRFRKLVSERVKKMAEGAAKDEQQVFPSWTFDMDADEEKGRHDSLLSIRPVEVPIARDGEWRETVPPQSLIDTEQLASELERSARVSSEEVVQEAEAEEEEEEDSSSSKSARGEEEKLESAEDESARMPMGSIDEADAKEAPQSRTRKGRFLISSGTEPNESKPDGGSEEEIDEESEETMATRTSTALDEDENSDITKKGRFTIVLSESNERLESEDLEGAISSVARVITGDTSQEGIHTGTSGRLFTVMEGAVSEIPREEYEDIKVQLEKTQELLKEFNTRGGKGEWEAVKRDSLGSGDRERVLSDRSEKSEAGDMSIDDAEVEEVLFGLDNAFEGAKHMIRRLAGRVKELESRLSEQQKATS